MKFLRTLTVSLIILSTVTASFASEPVGSFQDLKDYLDTSFNGDEQQIHNQAVFLTALYFDGFQEMTSQQAEITLGEMDQFLRDYTLTTRDPEMSLKLRTLAQEISKRAQTVKTGKFKEGVFRSAAILYGVGAVVVASGAETHNLHPLLLTGTALVAALIGMSSTVRAVIRKKQVVGETAKLLRCNASLAEQLTRPPGTI